MACPRLLYAKQLIGYSLDHLHKPREIYLSGLEAYFFESDFNSFHFIRMENSRRLEKTIIQMVKFIKNIKHKKCFFCILFESYLVCSDNFIIQFLTYLSHFDIRCTSKLFLKYKPLFQQQLPFFRARRSNIYHCWNITNFKE